MRHLESTVCYFTAGSFKTHQYATCKSGKMYRELAYVISFAPYYWRAMQVLKKKPLKSLKSSNRMCQFSVFTNFTVKLSFNFYILVWLLVCKVMVWRSWCKPPRKLREICVCHGGSRGPTNLCQAAKRDVDDYGIAIVASGHNISVIIRLCQRLGTYELILKNKSIYYISIVSSLFLVSDY